MRIVLGVGGGIAAYKVASLLRLFTEAGHDVTVIPTEAATRFVGVATWEALSGNPVSNSVFDDVHQVNHVRLGHEADLIVVAPATADLLARAATGQANDLLTNTLLMASGPVLFAPAMHTEMWQHAATQANVETLRGPGRRPSWSPPAGGSPARTPVPAACPSRRPSSTPPWPWLQGEHRTIQLPARRPDRHHQRRRHPRTPGPGAVPRATAPPASRASRWPWPPATPAPPSGCWPPTWKCPPPAGVEVVPGGDGPAAAGSGAGARQPIPTSSSWPPRWRTSAPPRSPAPRSRSATTPPTPSSRLIRNPDILHELVELRDAATTRRAAAS